jgi:hypothetical protein
VSSTSSRATIWRPSCLHACIDRSLCCGGNISKGKKNKNLEIENYDMLASELGHTNACINVHHNLSNVRSDHYQGGYESNIFLPGTTPSFGAVHERSCGIIHNHIIYVELNAKNLELIGIAKAK